MLTGLPPLVTVMNVNLTQKYEMSSSHCATDTHECHVAVNRHKGRVFDTVPEHAQQDIQAIERERREYPGRCVRRVVANSDEKCDVTKYTS